MAGQLDENELERLGLYDPTAADAADRLGILHRAFELGATIEEVIEASELTNFGGLLLDLVMRPPGDTQTLTAFAQASGLDTELMRQLWLALGLPDSDSVPVRVTPDAAEALRFLAEMTALLGEEVVLALSRVIGSSVARMTEALSEAFRVGVEVPQRLTGASYWQVADDYTTLPATCCHRS